MHFEFSFSSSIFFLYIIYCWWCTKIDSLYLFLFTKMKKQRMIYYFCCYFILKSCSSLHQNRNQILLLFHRGKKKRRKIVSRKWSGGRWAGKRSWDQIAPRTLTDLEDTFLDTRKVWNSFLYWFLFYFGLFFVCFILILDNIEKEKEKGENKKQKRKKI